ncbi:hypothetical protein Golomagni_04001 [Golovinomyces magnicellulatus]|nr:hypothetical protein Golomagni_04001 [Golovinomyces magnicellulatus]
MSQTDKEIDIKRQRDLSGLPKGPQFRVYKVAGDFISIQIKSRDSSASRLQARSHKLASLISRFEKLDAMKLTTSVPNFGPASCQNSEFALRPSRSKTSRSGINKMYSKSNSDQKNRDWDRNLPRQNTIIVHLEKPLKSQSSSPQGLRKKFKSLDYIEEKKSCQADKIGMRNFQGSSGKFNGTCTPKMQNCTKKNTRAVSEQEGINIFGGSISASRNDKAGCSVESLVTTRSEDLRKVRRDNEIPDLSSTQKQRLSEKINLNLPKLISNERSDRTSMILGSEILKASPIQKSSLKDSNSNFSPQTSKVLDWGETNAISNLSKKKIKTNSTIKDCDFSISMKDQIYNETEEIQGRKHEPAYKAQNLKIFGRRPSDKIEALFLQGLDKVNEKSRRDQNWNFDSYPTLGKSLCEQKKRQRIASIRKKFELRPSLERSIVKTQSESVKPSFFRIQSCRQDKKFIEGITSSLETTGSQGPSQKLRLASNLDLDSVETVRKNMLVEAPVEILNSQKTKMKRKMSAVTTSTVNIDRVVPRSIGNSNVHFIMPGKKPAKSNFGLVEDKIKQFEETETVLNSTSLPRKKSFTRRLNYSLKRFFEKIDFGEKPCEKAEKLRADKSSSSWDESQCFKTHNIEPENVKVKFDVTLSKNSTILDSLKESLVEKIRSSSLGETDAWFTKKVNCGLEQPKPLRAVEMKRMMLLCRGRFGSGNMTRNSLAW